MAAFRVSIANKWKKIKGTFPGFKSNKTKLNGGSTFHNNFNNDRKSSVKQRLFLIYVQTTFICFVLLFVFTVIKNTSNL